MATSTRTRNKIVKELLDEGTYTSKAREKFMKAEAAFNEARHALAAEAKEVSDRLYELEDVQYDKAVKEEGSEGTAAVWRKFDPATSMTRAVMRSAGYNYEGYDVLAYAWESSSFDC